MNRLEFFDSISGIEYPEMLVDFFDQFVALKQIVDSSGTISVSEKSDRSISFNIIFNNQKNRDKALNNVTTNTVIIYGRPISVNVTPLSDTEIKFILQ